MTKQTGADFLAEIVRESVKINNAYCVTFEQIIRAHEQAKKIDKENLYSAYRNAYALLVSKDEEEEIRKDFETWYEKKFMQQH